MKHLVLALALSILAAGTAAAEPTTLPDHLEDVSSVSWWVGDVPRSCVEVGDDLRFCTWRVYNADGAFLHFAKTVDAKESVSLVCSVQNSESVRSCAVFALDDGAPPPAPPAKGVGRLERRARSKKAEIARGQLDAAKTVDDMVNLLGAAPNRCALGRLRQCSWDLDHDTPGHRFLELATDQRGERFRFFCAFARDTECRTLLIE